MNTLLRMIGFGLIAIVLSFVLGIVLTVTLFPFWGWLEATTGIESVGHSGPAAWCYVVSMGVVFVIVVVIFSRVKRGKRSA
jgi:hypothetical protein